MTKKKIEFTLSWPPSRNGALGFGRGRVYLKKHIKKYYDDCHYELIRQFTKIPKFFTPVKILYEFWPPDNRIWDEENHTKTLKDAIKLAGVIPDDSTRFLKPQAPVYHKPKKPGWVKITLSEI